MRIAHNALGQLTYLERYQSTSSTYPALRTVYTYDSGNRLSNLAHRHVTSGSESTLLVDYQFTYDHLHRLRQTKVSGTDFLP